MTDEERLRPTRREYLSLTAAGGLGYAGLGALDATAGGDVVWRQELDLEVDRSSPTIVDGTVYVGTSEISSSLDDDGALYAIDAATGAEVWRFEEPVAIDASPTVLGGTVYVGDEADGLYAVDAATGEPEWTFTGADGSFTRSPTVAGGTVYAVENGFQDTSSAMLYAVDATTGGEVWRAEAGEEGSAPTVVDGTVHVGGVEPETRGFALLSAFDAATGSRQLRLPLEGKAGRVPPAPTVVDGTVYTGTSAGLFAVDVETGDVEWQFDDVPEGSEWSSPTVADGTLYVGQDGPGEEAPSGNVFAVDATTGGEVWRVNVDEPVGALESALVSSSPTVAGGVVFVGSAGYRDEGGTLYALDAVTGETVWSFDAGSGDINSSPTVVDGVVYVGTTNNELYALDAGVASSSVDSRVNLGTLGHHHRWQGGRGFRVAVAEETVAAGLSTELLVELGNVDSDPVTGLAVEASADDGVTAEIRDAPARVAAEEMATAVLAVETPADRTAPVTVEVTAGSDRFDAFTRTVALEPVAPARVSVVPEASPDPARVDTGAGFTFEVTANDVQAVEEVALVPRFDEVAGDWSVHEPVANPDALRHAGGRWGSATVPERSELDVWGMAELAPGMAEQPGIELTVPEALEPKAYELPVDLLVAGADGERFVADRTTYTFEVAKRYLSPLLLAPEEPIVDAEQARLEVELLVSRGSVVNPTLTLDPFPDAFEVVDGAAPDEAFLSIENRSVEWGGVHEADSRLAAEFVVDLPDGERAGGSYPVGLSATGDIPEIEAERTRSTSTVVTVSDLVGQVAGKRAKADRIDRITTGIDDRGRVEEQLTAITDAVDAGDLDPVPASQGVERMWLGERLLERSYEVATGVTPTNTIDRGYSLIRPLAEDVVSVAVLLGTFGVAKIAKLAPSTGRIGGAAIRKAGEWGLTATRRVIRDLVALGYRARRAARSTVRRAKPSIPQPLPDDLYDFFSTPVQSYVEGAIGIDELRGRLSDPFVSLVEGHLRGWFESWTASELDGLHERLTASAIAGGLPGGQVAARGAFATALSGMEFRARRAHELTGAFNDGIGPILGDMRTTLEEIYPLADDPDIREILELTQQSFDLFMTFFTGGAVSMLIGGAAVLTIDGARGAGIEHLTEGRDISGSL